MWGVGVTTSGRALAQRGSLPCHALIVETLVVGVPPALFQLTTLPVQVGIVGHARTFVRAAGMVSFSELLSCAFLCGAAPSLVFLRMRTYHGSSLLRVAPSLSVFSSSNGCATQRARSTSQTTVERVRTLVKSTRHQPSSVRTTLCDSPHLTPLQNPEHSASTSVEELSHETVVVAPTQ